MIRFSYNRITTYNDEVNDIPQNGFVIVYLNNQTINYIIDKNSDAKSVLRILLSYTGKMKSMITNFILKTISFSG